MKKSYSGLIAALVTPYTVSGTVNYHELKKLVRHLIKKNIDGFYVGGSTSEAFLLTQDERKNILETVAEENNGEKLVVAHVGQISTELASDLAIHAKSCGADAISAISPFYYKFSVDEVIQYYFDIIESSEMPMFIYNFPALSGFSVTNDVLQRLRVNKNVVGVKFTSNDFFQMERMKNRNVDLTIWNGFDEMLLSGLAAGADGGVGSTYNCIPELIQGIYHYFCIGNLEQAQKYQRLANNIIEVICKHGVFESIKYILETDGFSFGNCRKPFAKITEEGKVELRQVIADTYRQIE